MSLRIQPVRLHFTINKNWQRPAYTGSLFRGLFGHSLKALCCMTDGNCTSCPLRTNCIYAQTFEPRAAVFNNPNSQIPPPFVINPPLASAPKPMQKGDRITLDIHLFGPAIQWLPVLLTAWQNICHYEVTGLSDLFHLQQAELLDLNNNSIQKGLPAQLSGPFTGYLPELPEPATSYSLKLLTPLRLRQQKHNVSAEQLTGELFIKSLLRRYSLLVKHYSPEQQLPKLSPQNISYPVLSKTLQWSDWQRWSNRQQQSIKLGGLIGNITLQGDLQSYRAALSYLPWINLGKSCSLGLGRIQSVPTL